MPGSVAAHIERQERVVWRQDAASGPCRIGALFGARLRGFFLRTFSRALAAFMAFVSAIILLLRLGRELRHFSLHFPVTRQHPLETGVERLGDIGPLLEPGEQKARGFNGGETVAARFLAQHAVARRALGSENDSLAFQHPGIAPPQCLSLAPGAVEQHDAFDVFENGALMLLQFALSVDRDDLLVGVEVGDLGRAEIEDRPTRGIVDLPSQRLGEARPGQAYLDDRILEMKGGQPRRAERPVLFLRVLQDQELDPVLDEFDAFADAKRQRLAAMRAIRNFVGNSAGRV